MDAPRTEHGDYHYEIDVHHPTGAEHVHRYASDAPLEPGALVRLEGRYWLIERIDGTRVSAKPARYRLVLRHLDGTEEEGASRRFRAGSPRLGHQFSTIQDGRPASWRIVEERLAEDDDGEPYLELVAERDFSEVEEAPDHELEHALSQRLDEDVPEAAQAMFARAAEEGNSLELVALEPGEEPDWAETQNYIDALTLDVLGEDVIKLCGVDPDRQPQETWLPTVKERLTDDRDSFRADVEREHDEIEEWSFGGGRIFATVGTAEDEADPDSPHGWMCRLLDSGVLGVAGFQRVQKARLELLEP
ncbi:MAG TPA: hypothetical protein VGU26_06280 [Gaiellaceae bacterium]|nr:hypothetical protein [Gaiellaceae bacterium]